MIKASATVTITCYRDTKSITRYYKLQSSTASAPSKPTTNPPPSGWNDAEPTYTSGSTSTLYFCDLSVFSDGTFSYSTVSKSSSYEAAKEAYNKAQNAQNTANSAKDFTDKAKNNYGYQYKYDITINGDSSMYYPVILRGGNQNVMREIMVQRSYNEKAPIDWNGHPTVHGISLQTKWHGTNITLSSTKPTRTGYTFKGWATSASGSVAYASGATYSTNATVKLYAVWQAITYKVTYNANGGSGAPGQQTKTYGKTLVLSMTKPTRTNYNFKGWATSAKGSVAYAAGANYTSNAAITLHAVWEIAYTPPTITNLKLQRCDSSGTALETGTYCKISFSWSCSQLAGSNPVKSITITWGSESSTVTASGNSGSSSKVVGGSLSVDSTYTFSIKVTDNKNGATTVKKTLGTTKFPIDFKNGGTGVAFGKTAELDNIADFGYKAKYGNASIILLHGAHGNAFTTCQVQFCGLVAII